MMTFLNKKHDDDYEKHPITKEEVLFLKNLQDEMNTQDTFATADPRYWIIKGKQTILNVDEETADGIAIFDQNEKIKANGFKEIAEFIESSVLCGKNSEWSVSYEEGCGPFSLRCIRVKDITSGSTTSLYTANDINEWLDKMEVSSYISSYKCAYFAVEGYDYPNTLFLTYEDAAEHLNKFSYHYDESAHPYCCCAQMSPRLEALYKILHEVDFDSLITDDKLE